MSSVTLDEIIFDETIYPRAAWSQATVDRYADALNAGEHFPPIILEAGTRRLLDGKHRVEAHTAIGRHFIAADYVEIPEGIPPVLYAASLSARHGDPLASEDKRRVAREIAEANPDFSMVTIAKQLGTTRQTVSRYVADLVEHRREIRRARAELLSRAGWTNPRIAEQLGVTHPTVGTDLKEMSAVTSLSEEIFREAADGLPIDAAPIVAAILAERTPNPTPDPGSSDAAHRPPVGPATTPEPAGADLSAAQPPGSGTGPAPVADAPAVREPDPEPVRRLTLVPDVDEVEAAERRDARALLSRGVDLLAPASWNEDNVRAWIKHMGADDEELAALKARAAAAIVVLTRVIEEAGR